jgi:phosphoadenosine phosphosulfate reductase
MDIESLNQQFKPLSPKERIEKLFKDFDKVLVTSSFGTTSAYILHLVNQVKPSHTVHFIDTTYHFRETMSYKDELTRLMDLNVHVLKGEQWKNEYTRHFRIWETEPDICCSINKVEPIEKIKGDYQVWVSGLMHWQSSSRENLNVFQKQGNLLKFYPIIDVNEDVVDAYYQEYHIPTHPLKDAGYESVGCLHCTKQGKRREGRWVNFFKNECGLHI